jgi:hypothetical protein
MFPLRRCLLYHPSRGHIFRTGSEGVGIQGVELRELVSSALSEGVDIQGKRKGTCSSAATRIVLAKDARRAVAVDTVTAE